MSSSLFLMIFNEISFEREPKIVASQTHYHRCRHRSDRTFARTLARLLFFVDVIPLDLGMLVLPSCGRKHVVRDKASLSCRAESLCLANRRR